MTKPKEPPKMALLEINGHVILPLEFAAQAFALLCHGEIAEYNWSKKGYVRKQNESYTKALSMRQFSVAEYAAMVLNDEEEPTG